MIRMSHHFLSILTCIMIASSLYGQSKDDPILGVQAGYAGFWFYKESRIAGSIHLRREFGAEYNYGHDSDAADVNRYFGFEPVITLAPRWYYNMKSREEKGKNTLANAGNFFSINARAKINPRMLLGAKYVNNFNELSIMPSWGIRRNVTSRFNYEFMLGIGYFYYDTYDLRRGSKTSYYSYDMQIRLGYRFR